MTRQTGTLSLLALTAIAGCGGGRGGANVGGVELERPSAAVEGARGRRCHYIGLGDVPAFDDLVRLGTRGNLALWGRDAEPTDTVELSIRYDDEGRLAWVQTLSSSMAPVRSVELERLMRSAIEEDGPEEWGVRIRFAGGEVDQVLPSVVCDPVRTSWGTGVVPLGSNREVRELYQSLGHAITVEVSLDELGRVMDVRLAHTSGSRLLDQFVLDQARSSQYDPKLHDGLGVPSVLTLSLRYRRRL